MTKTVTVQAAETRLSELIAEVEAGGEVVIARAGTPVARLVPAGRDERRPRFGMLAGRLRVPDGFSDPLPDEELDAWGS